MPEVKQYKLTEPYLKTSCGLGEAPFWEKSRNSLRFVDIVQKRMHYVDLSTGPSSLQTQQLPFSIGTTADIEGNDKEFIFGGKKGYGTMNRETGKTTFLKQMWNDEERQGDGGGKAKGASTREERMRSNDGAVDARGRFFVGAMNDPGVVESITDEGVLFRLDPDLSLHRVKSQVKIPNGISWSLDNKTCYFTDSPTGKISAYPYDIETGDIGFNKGKPFFTCPYEGGVPDGHAQDEERCFWVACFGTGKVVRVNPQGEVIAEISLPTRCPTCPAIAGTTLYITTAAEEEPEKYPWSKELAGSVFSVDIGVKGCPLNKFKMEAKA